MCLIFSFEQKKKLKKKFYQMKRQIVYKDWTEKYFDRQEF